MSELEQDGIASFHFIHGTVPSQPPNGFEEFSGSPPHFQFLDPALLGMTEDEIRNVIWDTPRYLTPEQQLQHLRHSIRARAKGADAIRQVLDRIYRIMDEEGPFDGILGNSEGATVAATFLVDYLQKVAKNEREPELRCAVFISGGAPFTADGKDVLLADEKGQLITIPTCHIIGWNDSVIDGSVALYHLCDEDSAFIVDHGKGHMVPHDEDSCKIMVKGIRDLILSCSASAVGGDEF